MTDKRASVPTYAKGVAAVVAAGQLVALGVLSAYFVHLAMLTIDFGIGYQAWHLIGHGVMNPIDTFEAAANGKNFPYWQNQFILAAWPLSIFSKLWDAPLFLKLAQDLATAGSTFVAAVWAWRLLLERPCADALRRKVSWGAWVVVLLVLTLNPWTYLANQFDVHYQQMATFFVILAAYFAWQARARAFLVCVVLTVLQFDVAATYVIGLSIAVALCAGRGMRVPGIAGLLIGVIWLFGAHALGAGKGSFFGETYSLLLSASSVPLAHATLSDVLVSILHHPFLALGQLLEKRQNVWANIAPTGAIGIAFPPALGIALPVLLSNNFATGLNYSPPLFQNVPIYPVVGVGTAWAISWAIRRWHAVVGAVLIGLIALNAAFWAIIWLPQIVPNWAFNTEAGARSIEEIALKIPPKATVIASQGIVGRFADRQAVYAWPRLFDMSLASFPAHLIIAPWTGIEVMPVNKSLAYLQYLVTHEHAKVISSDANVFYLVMNRASSNWYRRLPTLAPTVGAWELQSAIGTRKLEGDVKDWSMRSTPGHDGGYLLSGDYWREEPGAYRAGVVLSGSGSAVVEVWNASSGALILRNVVLLHASPTPVSVQFALSGYGDQTIFRGRWPFSVDRIPPPKQDALEVRIYLPRGTAARAYSVTLKPLASERF